jgi:hypothetical protein
MNSRVSEISPEPFLYSLQKRPDNPIISYEVIPEKAVANIDEVETAEELVEQGYSPCKRCLVERTE